MSGHGNHKGKLRLQAYVYACDPPDFKYRGGSLEAFFQKQLLPAHGQQWRLRSGHAERLQAQIGQLPEGRRLLLQHRAQRPGERAQYHQRLRALSKAFEYNPAKRNEALARVQTSGSDWLARGEIGLADSRFELLTHFDPSRKEHVGKQFFDQGRTATPEAAILLFEKAVKYEPAYKKQVGGCSCRNGEG